MSEYTERISELDKRAEVLAARLKEFGEWCRETIEKLEIIRAEQKQLRKKLK